MIMRAKQDGNTIVIHLEGHLDFETTQQFEETCASMIAKTERAQVVFNFEKLKFVGSSGINQFIKVLKDFNGLDTKPRLCHMSTEFVRLFRAYQTNRNPFEIFDSMDLALKSFESTPVPVKKPTKKKRSS